jgi:hypothetical protein
MRDTNPKIKIKNPKPHKVLKVIKDLKNPKKNNFVNPELKRLLDKKFLKLISINELKKDIDRYNKTYI